MRGCNTNINYLKKFLYKLPYTKGHICKYCQSGK